MKTPLIFTELYQLNNVQSHTLYKLLNLLDN